MSVYAIQVKPSQVFPGRHEEIFGNICASPTLKIHDSLCKSKKKVLGFAIIHAQGTFF